VDNNADIKGLNQLFTN